ncbi:hypothetical protein A9D60_15550 [Leisingera sp. JC1]|nr:hypothetical protein A9D60_15550 [Leisingera sp. JC1]
MMGNCNGVALIGGADYQAFVLAATEVASQQGLRKNKLRKLLFYGQTAWLKEQAADVLSARGIDAGSQRSVCSLARKVAGKNDAIGRYLELE